MVEEKRTIKRLGSEELARLADLLPEKTYAPGQTLFETGAQGTDIYIVRSGKVKLYQELADGREFVFEEAVAGDFFGEVAALLQGSRTASAAAVDHAVVLIVDGSRLEEVLAHTPEVGAVLIQSMARRLRRSSEQIRFLQASRENAQGPRPAARVPEFIGSPWFLLLIALVLIGWSLRDPRFDPAGTYLGLFLSVLQIIVVVLVLRSQNLTARYEELIDMREREANLISEAEISALHRKFDEQRHDLEIKLGALEALIGREPKGPRKSEPPTQL